MKHIRNVDITILFVLVWHVCFGLESLTAPSFKHVQTMSSPWLVGTWQPLVLFVSYYLFVYLFIAVRSFFSTSEMSKFNFTGQRGLRGREGTRGLILKMFIRVIWNKWLSKQNEVLAGAGSPVDLYKKLYSVELSWARSEHTHFLELCCSAETNSFSELLQYR